MTPLEKTFWFLIGVLVTLLVLRNTRIF